MIAGDQLPAAVVGRADDQRHEHAAQRDRLREVVDMLGVELAHVVEHGDLIQRETQLAGGRPSGGDTHHGVLPWTLMARLNVIVEARPG